MVRYAMVPCFLAEIDDEGHTAPMTVIEYIDAELSYDDITFANPDIKELFELTLSMLPAYREARALAEATARSHEAQLLSEGIDTIGRDHAAEGVAAMERAEAELRERLAAGREAEIDLFDSRYAEQILISTPDDKVRALATDLVADRHRLSKIHTKYSHVETERERLQTLVPRAVYELKYALLELRLREMGRRLAAESSDISAQISIMQAIQELHEVRKELARYLGERTLSARR